MTQSQEAPLWRSFLFIPALNKRFIAAAPTRGADVVQIDLEDSIPPDRKEAARAQLPSAADALSEAGCTVVVRINRPWRAAMADLDAAMRTSVGAITLPKVANANHVRIIAEILDELETERGLPPGHTKLIAMVETAGALAEIEAIACAHPRMAALTVGAEDLALDLGARPCRDVLLEPNRRAVAAARACGIMPIGYVGSVSDYTDLEMYKHMIEEARALGFEGGFAIHPSQVPILNAAFTPSPEEIHEAEAIVAAFNQTIAEGHGTASFDGKMIDLPVVQRARAILHKYARARDKHMANG